MFFHVPGIAATVNLFQIYQVAPSSNWGNIQRVTNICPQICGVVSRLALGRLSCANDLYPESRLKVYMNALQVPAYEAGSQNRGHWHMKALAVLHVKLLHRIKDTFWRRAVSAARDKSEILTP